MSWVTRPNKKAVYYFNVYDTETKKQISRIDREGSLKMNMIFDIKVDPSNQEWLYFTVANNSEATIIKWNMLSNTIGFYTSNQTIKQLPHFFFINDSCSQVFIGITSLSNKKKSVNLYSYDINFLCQVDFESLTDENGSIPFFSQSFLDGNNVLSVFNNEQNNFKAWCWGQVDFSRISWDEEVANFYEAKDLGLIDNQSILWITKFDEHSCKIELFPSDIKWNQVSFEIKENTIVDFIYPAVIVVKGWSEVIIYNITENIYYYLTLNAPVLMQSSSVDKNNTLEIKLFLDMGDYLIFSIISFPFGSNSSFSQSYFKRYLQKSVFPNEKLLNGFDPINTKFLTKDEEAITLHFSKTIVSISLLTYDLFQLTESDLECDELIHVSNDCFYTWKRSSNTILANPLPVNFSDR